MRERGVDGRAEVMLRHPIGCAAGAVAVVPNTQPTDLLHMDLVYTYTRAHVASSYDLRILQSPVKPLQKGTRVRAPVHPSDPRTGTQRSL